jgi:hypothetical protein
MAGTPYAETEALLAVLRDDESEAMRILAEMTTFERKALTGHAERLASLSFMWCDVCSQPIRQGQGHQGSPRMAHTSCLRSEGGS